MDFFQDPDARGPWDTFHHDARVCAPFVQVVADEDVALAPTHNAICFMRVFWEYFVLDVADDGLRLVDVDDHDRKYGVDAHGVGVLLDGGFDELVDENAAGDFYS